MIEIPSPTVWWTAATCSFCTRCCYNTTSCVVRRHICYKVHQGLPDVSMMLNEVPSNQAVLVHAPKEETDLVVARLLAEGHKELYSLQPGTELNLR